MDDFNVNSLTESRNEYSALFINKVTPCIIQGLNAIFNDACELCIENDEDEKYLMTFQNFLARVTKWNQEMVNRETERIVKETNCDYLEDLLTCIHVSQLKILTNIRAGTKQKKVSIDIPKLDKFIHNCYIEVARKVYKNVFLYDRSCTPLSRQKNLRELELITKECIINVIRNNMPVEEILKCYLNESVEDIVEEEKTEIKEIEEESKEEPKPEPEPEPKEAQSPIVKKDASNSNVQVNTDASNSNVILNDVSVNTPVNSNTNNELKIKTPVEPSNDKLKFNDTDKVINYDSEKEPSYIQTTPKENVEAPKDIKTLEKISTENFAKRNEEEDDDEEETESIKILDDADDVKLDIEKINSDSVELKSDPILDEIEVLT